MRTAIILVLGILVGLVVGYYAGIKERPRTVLVDGSSSSTSSSSSTPVVHTSDLEQHAGAGVELPAGFSFTAGV